MSVLLDDLHHVRDNRSEEMPCAYKITKKKVQNEVKVFKVTSISISSIAVT